jgi:hypothetical protein
MCLEDFEWPSPHPRVRDSLWSFQHNTMQTKFRYKVHILSLFGGKQCGTIRTNIYEIKKHLKMPGKIQSEVTVVALARAALLVPCW